ncbi:hypothetical protein B0H11DRAFT_2352418 [Mycena galericulata]|nr:hypothetical protein B0H11DRAFT_2352418 [Mycena galericulata]
MSDPAVPPFTQPAFPELHFDNAGRAWLRDANGQFSMAPSAPQARPNLGQDSTAAGPVQSGVQPAAYNFPPSFGAASSYRPQPLIDPSLLRLPEDNDFDLSDPSTIAKARGLKPAKKVAGSRHKDQDAKGKKRQLSSDSDSVSDAPVTKKGRRKGTPNYNKDDTNKLLDIIEKKRPLGQKGWKSVARSYRKWARSVGRPERDVKGLEGRYKLVRMPIPRSLWLMSNIIQKLLKTKKPTGDGHCPPEYKRAHRIEALIDQRAGARNLSDSDVDDGDDLSSDAESVEVLDAKPSDIHTAVARRAPTPPLRRNPRMNAPELVNKLAQAFDPEVQKSRDDDRTQRSFQNTQIFTLSQQLRDTQATVESLRNQITVMQNRTHDVERARDRAEFMLEVYEGRVSGHVKQERRMQRYRDHPDIVPVNSSARCETIYPDGGACTEWFGAGVRM